MDIVNKCIFRQPVAAVNEYTGSPESMVKKKVEKKIVQPPIISPNDCEGLLGRRRAVKGFHSLDFEKTVDDDIDKKRAYLKELKSKIRNYDCYFKCNMIEGEDHVLYSIDGNGVRTFAHRIPWTDNAVLSFWQLIKSQDIKKVMSLQELPPNLSYLPDPVAVDAVKTLSDGSVVKIVELTDLKNEFGGGNVKSLKVEIVYPDNQKHLIDIEQVFNWEDGGVLPIEQVKKLVDMVPDDNCQVHCLGGLGRTGTLIVIKQLSRDKQITEGNMLEKIAEAIARSRMQRGSPCFVETDIQLLLIVEYVLVRLHQGNVGSTEQLSGKAPREAVYVQTDLH